MEEKSLLRGGVDGEDMEERRPYPLLRLCGGAAIADPAPVAASAPAKDDRVPADVGVKNSVSTARICNAPIILG
jgi:hypothetical protein